MSFKLRKLATAIILFAYSSLATAIPFSSFDTRSMGMGGAGVAVDGADAAPLFNPALLSVAKDSDKFSILLPTIGIRVADPDKLSDSIDKFQAGNYVNNLQTAVNNFNAAPTPANATTVASNVTAVSTQLATLSNKPITADGGVATVVAIPGKRLGMAFFANGVVATGGVFMYNDAAALASLASNANLCAAPGGNPGACTAVQNFNTNTLTSGINFRGVTLGEFGFSLSREFQVLNQTVSFGITPKIIKAQLFDALIKANSNNQTNVTAADYLAEYNLANFDLGAAKNFDNGWRSGFVVKNVIPYTLDFKTAPTPGAPPVANGNTLTLRPQARIGVSHANKWSTIAMDVDLTRNDPSGLEKATRYIALGGELNAWNWAQLRAGYRVDTENSARNVASIGLGLSPFGVHADLAVAGNANEIGASFQLGFRY